MKTYKHIIFLSLIGLLFLVNTGSAQTINPEEKKVEINHKELPAGARTYIIDNFPGAEILKAYKVMKEDQVSGYLVEITQDGQKKSLYYDKDGLAKKQ